MSDATSRTATKRPMPRQDDTRFNVPTTSIHKIEADGVQVFYREAGDVNAPVVLLLHGFPASSFMFRELIPRLANDYRVIAPDLPGFGFTEVPPERQYSYTFDRLALTIDAFTQALKIDRYAIYVFDYGAPTGFRLAMAHPERVTAIVSQNGNAYEEGLGDAWGPIRKYWVEPTAENRDILRQTVLTAGGTRWQYTHGVANPEAVPPESYTLDTALLERPGNKRDSARFVSGLCVERDALSGNSRSISVNRNRLCLRSGARTILSSFPREQRPFKRICRTRRCNSSIPDTLRLRHTWLKSRPR